MQKMKKYQILVVPRSWYNTFLYNYLINQLVYEILIGKKSRLAQPCIVLLFDYSIRS